MIREGGPRWGHRGIGMGGQKNPFHPCRGGGLGKGPVDGWSLQTYFAAFRICSALAWIAPSSSTMAAQPYQ